MVEPGVDQLQRQDPHAQLLADPLVGGGVGPGAVAGEERLAAEQGVAGALVVHLLGQVLDGEPVRGEPGVEERRLAGPHLVLEPAAEERVAEHEPGVGGEHEVRQSRPRVEGLDRDAA